MTTQISFNGEAEDFAWILPLSVTPDPNSLSVDFPQAALNALDTNTAPTFNLPTDQACIDLYSCPSCAGAGPPRSAQVDEGVDVELRAVVGSYEVAVISSEDPEALITWLIDNGYRITSPMRPYIGRYTEEGLKFMALRLTETAEVEDIKPFRFTLPGTTPSIPLRMTALAAEPEMAIVVFVLGAERFEGKNWPNLQISDDQLLYNPLSPFVLQTNWPKLVAQAVDAAGGQGWVTEYAGASEPYAALVQSQIESGSLAPDAAEAATALLASLQAHPYLTRLYTRLSAEEMTSDPVLGLSAGGDVDNQHQLSRFVGDVDQCSEGIFTSTDPCEFVTCGAAGLCRAVLASDVVSGGAPVRGVISTGARVAGCACLPGATARPTFAPDGTPTVICQDGRLSFLNPGDRESAAAEVLPDACAGFSCGDHGQCVAINMTPTCVCDQGFVAVPLPPNVEGQRRIKCVEAPDVVPASFYKGRLPALPDDLPGGRQVIITEPIPMPDDGEPNPAGPISSEPPGTFPTPRNNPQLAAPTSSGAGACSIGAVQRPASIAPWLIGLVLAALGVPVRRRSRP
jgi:hypothetical protein